MILIGGCGTGAKSGHAQTVLLLLLLMMLLLLLVVLLLLCRFSTCPGIISQLPIEVLFGPLLLLLLLVVLVLLMLLMLLVCMLLVGMM